MVFRFRKYQATGNDFVIVDNRDGKISFSIDQIKKICDRRFGIGADGLIQIEKASHADFKMVYYNSDGSQSLCGNGSRAAVMMASSLGMVNGKAKFSAYDGIHHAALLGQGLVAVQMNPVKEWKKTGEDFFMNTGSPHFIRFVRNIKDYPVVEQGRLIRNSDAFKPAGTNVNFVELLDNNSIFVRTYERGVEDETFSCGTGVTAAALAASTKGYTSPIEIIVMGGKLSVGFTFSQTVVPIGQAGVPAGQEGMFDEIFLTGPAKMVFEGELEL